MDTWYKVGLIAPYIVALFYGLGYFFKKKDKRTEDDHTLLNRIDKRLEQIEIKIQSDAVHLKHIDIEQDVHERWFAKVCEQIRNIRRDHRQYHSENNYDLDLTRPEPLK